MKLFLASGETFEGESFGADVEKEGEVVFTTGMAGYLEILTDPSYYGQIVVFTFPLIGNYGVYDQKEFMEGIDQTFESKKIWVKGVILTEESIKYSHCEAVKSFSTWLKEQGIPAMSGLDTRELTQILREHGTILGKLGKTKPRALEDPLNGRFVPEVSPKEVQILEPVETSIYGVSKPKTIAFLDCGAKNAILRNFLKRGIRIIRCPFDQNPFELDEKIDGLFISNGPGDPEQCTETIEIVKQVLEKDIPIFGICLGNQILSLAAGGKTRKMKYGHRGVNQPVIEIGKSKIKNQKEDSRGNPSVVAHDKKQSETKNEEVSIHGVSKEQMGRCLITSQNHGFEVDPESLPAEFEVWFKNLNDGSVEGIRHKSKPICSVQFHPEACAGPEDAEYLFDEFIAEI